jgi:hypothetical protein
MRILRRKLVKVLMLVTLFTLISDELSAQAGHAPDDVPALADEFNQAFQRQLRQDETFFQTKRIGTIWDGLDAIVITLLNSGDSPEQVRKLFSMLAGFEAPSNTGTVVGNATFYSSPPHETPTYVLTPPNGMSGSSLFGVFNYGLNGRGRLSVYTNSAGRWVRTSRFDSESPIYVYQLSPDRNVLPLVTVEKVTGGDHTIGYLKGWFLKRGKLVSQQIRPGPLMDHDVENASDGITVSYQEHPGLNESFVGTRIQYRLEIRAPQGRFQLETTVLNPWLKTVSAFYRSVEDGNVSKAKQLLADESLYEILARNSPMLNASDGDLNDGAGFVTLGGLRVGVRRTTSGQWRITAADRIPN